MNTNLIKKILLLMFLLAIFLFPCSAKGKKTIMDIVSEGKNSYMPGTWDISFRRFSSESGETFEFIKMTVIIANETDAQNKKEVNAIELIEYDSNNNETKRSISFEELLNVLKDFDFKFYVEHDIEKLNRNNTSIKYILKGSRFAYRENKDQEYDEIIAKQTLIKKSKDKEEEDKIIILFDMEKRVRTR